MERRKKNIPIKKERRIGIDRRAIKKVVAKIAEHLNAIKGRNLKHRPLDRERRAKTPS